MFNIRTICSEAVHLLWSIFLNGLLTILPLTLTFAIFNFSLKLLARWLEPIRRLQPILFNKIPYSEILLTACIILLIGVILRFFLLKKLIETFESLLSKIPLVNQLYSGIKQLVNALDPQNNNAIFQKVVIIEFPRPGIYSLGFLTNQVPTELTPNKQERFFSIFLSTTPNPTTGFYLIVAEKDLIITDLTRQEATTIIISGGIIQPDRFIKKPMVIPQK